MKTNILTTINLKIAAISASILSLTLLITANTASSFAYHEPQQPKSIERFKKIK